MHEDNDSRVSLSKSVPVEATDHILKFEGPISGGYKRDADKHKVNYDHPANWSLASKERDHTMA